MTTMGCGFVNEEYDSEILYFQRNRSKVVSMPSNNDLFDLW